MARRRRKQSVRKRQERQVGYFSQTKAGDETKAAGETHGLNGGAGSAKPREPAMNGKTAAMMVSTLGPGMLITGNIVCEGSAQIFGRVIGDIQAVEIVIGDGARVEGNVTAHEVGINGAFKGTIRGHNVRLKGTATIDGEIYSKSLTVEENVKFEGVSRRLDKSIELPTCAAASGEQPAATATTDAASTADTGAADATGF
jgi:cytoskeletal protein CcmA (bactofilin family)